MMKVKITKRCAAVFLTVIMLVNMANLAAFGETIAKEDYYDVTSHWANGEITRLINEGVVSGSVKDGVQVIRPDESITRAEFLKLVILSKLSMAKMEELSTTLEGADGFNDIEGHWAANYIKLAKRMMIVDGYEDGSFKPDSLITRGEAAKMLTSIDKRIKYLAEGDAADFQDVSDDYWGYSYVNLARETGLVNGYDGNVFKPLEMITRAESMVMVDRLIDKSALIDFTENLKRIQLTSKEASYQSGDTIEIKVDNNSWEALIDGVRRVEQFDYSIHVVAGELAVGQIGKDNDSYVFVTDETYVDNIFARVEIF